MTESCLMVEAIGRQMFYSRPQRIDCNDVNDQWPANQLVAAQIDSDVAPDSQAVVPHQIALRGQPQPLGAQRSAT
jgi:hypothetical protein